MRQIIINEDTRYLLIGYESENNVTQVVFPYDESWLSCGDGEFKIRVLRNCDTNAYNATNVIDDREAKTLTMTITDIELSVEGPGEFQICYICGNTIKKSKIYRYIVNRAIDSEIVDPPQGSIINEVIQSLAELRTNYNNLNSQVEDVENSIGYLTELETQNKDDLVSAINEVANKTIEVDSELSTTSKNPIQNKIIKAEITRLDDRIGGIQNNVNAKADKTVATTSANGLMSSTDKIKLDSLNNDVSDVQVNGTSIVADGVAEIPIASADNFGISKVVSNYGLYINPQTGTLCINAAPISAIKSGTNTFYPITSGHQHESTFYGLAKASGDTTQSQSDNEVGVYTEDAKFAIRTMLGLQDVYEDYSSALVALGVIDNG